VIARPPAQHLGGDVAVLAVLIVALVWLVDTSGHPARPASPTTTTTRPHASATTLPGPGTPVPAGLTFTDLAGCRPAGDWSSPRLDRRVRQLLIAAAAHHRVRVSCIRTGHSWFVKGTSRVSNHSVWRAVDVDQVDGRPVSPSNQAPRQLALWIGRGSAGVQPSEVGSPAADGPPPFFTDSGHQDHIHVGFAGPTRAGG